MKDFIKFLQRFGIIHTLFDHYQLRKDDQEIINELLDLLTSDSLKSSNLDLIAAVYEKLTPHQDRKKMGEFYTPIKIVQYIIHNVGYSVENRIEDKKLIDISCGSGSFLIQAVSILLKVYLEKFQVNVISELSEVEAIQIIDRVKSNIYGIDNNPLACIFCQINIYYTLFDLFKLFSKFNPNYKFPIFNILNKNILETPFEPKFDYIIGNPPYLFIRDIPETEKKYIENSILKTAKGQYDLYQLFIEIGIKLLNAHGKLGFIIPDSILALSHRNVIRKYIYDNTLIKQISYVGPQFDDPVVSNVILILERVENLKKRDENRINILIDSESKQFPQKLIKEWEYRFLIHLTDVDIDILHHLNSNFPKLKNLMVLPEFEILLSRGIELTKEGNIIYCKYCRQYFPVPRVKLKCPRCRHPLDSDLIEKIVVDKLPEVQSDNYAPFLFQINRYQIKERKFLELEKEGINYKSADIYKDRIVIRQLNQNNLICATYDNFSYTSQSLYNLKIIKSPINEFNNFYLLGLLNSSLLSYYFIKTFGSYKQLFPRILIEKIQSLPMKLPKSQQEKRICQQINNLINYVLNLDDISEISEYQKQIDKRVFKLFNLNEQSRSYIMDTIKNT